MSSEVAHEVVERCRMLAEFTEEPGFTTRTFLSPPMRDVHRCIAEWMSAAGMMVRVDAAGNLRARHASDRAPAQRFFIASHLDSVPHAGAFDGILGVVLGVTLVEQLRGRRFPFDIEVVGFSDEEGGRFGAPFIGSRAMAGTLDQDLLGRTDAAGRTVIGAIQDFGLNPGRLAEAVVGDDALGYLEFHIEQGPVLADLQLPLGIVTAIVGQSRFELTFGGMANHAGTTPMTARLDALAGAAEWIGRVERAARATPGLVATVGEIAVEPGAVNVIPGACRVSLDVRHAEDVERAHAVARILGSAKGIADDRGLTVSVRPLLEQPAVAMDPALVSALERAVARAGAPLHRMPSGAGHDAMIMAARMPAAMLFVRSPGGLSHHPDEMVVEGDVALALAAGRAFLEELAGG